MKEAHTLIRMMLAGEHALNERRIAVGTVRAFLSEFEKPGPDGEHA